MRVKTIHLHIKRNKWTRLLAFVLALAIIGGLLWYVDRRQGNPLGAWYAEKKIEAHYRAYHPDETYVVGPATYQYILNAGLEEKMCYVCNVYKKGSSDTGFQAYFKDGAVLCTRAWSVDSGRNTYNRLYWRMNDQLQDTGLEKALEQQGADSSMADFYPGERMLFNPEAPAFAVDMEYDFRRLPVPTVLSVTYTADDARQVSDGTLAEKLLEIKAAAVEHGMPFDYYTVTLSFYGKGFSSYANRQALDVPAGEITREGVRDYVEALSEEKKTQFSQAWYESSAQGQKSGPYTMGVSKFLPCEH